MSTTKSLKPNPVAEDEFDQLSRDLENIELMNEWGKEDSEQARRKTAEVKSKQSQPVRDHG